MSIIVAVGSAVAVSVGRAVAVAAGIDVGCKVDVGGVVGGMRDSMVGRGGMVTVATEVEIGVDPLGIESQAASIIAIRHTSTVHTRQPMFDVAPAWARRAYLLPNR
jgi:hypothetical protein